MSAEKMTVREAMESLTGFDEIAIEKAFGKELDELSGRMTVRALIFVQEKRAGASDKDARRIALELPMKDLDDRFEASEDDEIDEDEPETEQGKGDSDAA